MIDIVERLRQRASMPEEISAYTMGQAANEIEALTAEIDELRQVIRLLTDPATQAETLRIYRDRIKENGNASVTR